jgi:hypothetical protein
MRTLFGIGTPRGLQGRLAAVLAFIVALWTRIIALWCDPRTPLAARWSAFRPHHHFELLPIGPIKRSPLTTGC